MDKKYSKNSRTVFSTEVGRICPECANPVTECRCKQQKSDQIPGDGIVRIRREVKGRRGKTVTTISGVPLNNSGLDQLASELKRKCGVGGSVKDKIIILQGDQRSKITPLLKDKGFTVKSG